MHACMHAYIHTYIHTYIPIGSNRPLCQSLPLPFSAMSAKMPLLRSMNMAQRLKTMSLSEVRVAGDGNCQVSAIHASLCNIVRSNNSADWG